jgi:hypothetical protein
MVSSMPALIELRTAAFGLRTAAKDRVQLQGVSKSQPAGSQGSTSASSTHQQHAQEPRSSDSTPEKEVSLQSKIDRFKAEQQAAHHMVAAAANPLLAAAIVQRGGEIADLEQQLSRAVRKRKESRDNRRCRSLL